MSNLINKIYTKNTIERINKKIKLFGLSHNYNVDELLTIHLILTILILLIANSNRKNHIARKKKKKTKPTTL